MPGPYGPEDIAFRCLYGVGSSMRSFRGWITRPAPSLSTLRRLGYPRPTQDSLPAGGHPWPGRIGYLLGSRRRVSKKVTLSSSSPPFPGFAWRKKT